MVVGWSALIGLLGIRYRQYAAWVCGIAGGTVAMLNSGSGPLHPDLSLLGLGAALGVALVGACFQRVFRSVGEMMRRNEEELRQFFDRVPVALNRTTADGTVLEYNRAAAEMFRGLPAYDHAQAWYQDSTHREGFVATLMEQGSIRNFETRLRVGEDEMIDAVISANAVLDDKGDLRYVESATFDLTSLRSAEREREELAQVIDSTSDLVAIVDSQGWIRYANAAARDWVRTYVTDERYTHITQPVRADDVEMLRKALRENGSWSGELVVDGKMNDRFVSVTLQMLDVGEEKGFASIARDVTDEIATAQQLESLLKAKDEFVAAVSHEIRTPLSVVLGLAAELRDGGDGFDGATRLELASLISEQAQEVADIVEDLLVAARADTGSIVLVEEKVDLANAVDMTLRALPQGGVNRIESTVTGVCWADGGRVRQILRNLLTNALRYGGERVVVSTRAENTNLLIEVVDNGAGVPEEKVEAVFLPFESAHLAGSQPGSVGLGLTISRDLARRMGGELTYERRSGTTVFTLTLPTRP